MQFLQNQDFLFFPTYFKIKENHFLSTSLFYSKSDIH